MMIIRYALGRSYPLILAFFGTSVQAKSMPTLVMSETKRVVHTLKTAGGYTFDELANFRFTPLAKTIARTIRDDLPELFGTGAGVVSAAILGSYIARMLKVRPREHILVHIGWILSALFGASLATRQDLSNSDVVTLVAAVGIIACLWHLCVETPAAMTRYTQAELYALIKQSLQAGISTSIACATGYLITDLVRKS